MVHGNPSRAPHGIPCTSCHTSCTAGYSRAMAGSAITYTYSKARSRGAPLAQQEQLQARCGQSCPASSRELPQAVAAGTHVAPAGMDAPIKQGAGIGWSGLQSCAHVVNRLSRVAPGGETTYNYIKHFAFSSHEEPAVGVLLGSCILPPRPARQAPP